MLLFIAFHHTIILYIIFLLSIIVIISEIIEWTFQNEYSYYHTLLTDDNDGLNTDGQ